MGDRRGTKQSANEEDIFDEVQTLVFSKAAAVINESEIVSLFESDGSFGDFNTVVPFLILGRRSRLEGREGGGGGEEEEEKSLSAQKTFVFPIGEGGYHTFVKEIITFVQFEDYFYGGTKISKQFSLRADCHNSADQEKLLQVKNPGGARVYYTIKYKCGPGRAGLCRPR